MQSRGKRQSPAVLCASADSASPRQKKESLIVVDARLGEQPFLGNVKKLVTLASTHQGRPLARYGGNIEDRGLGGSGADLCRSHSDQAPFCFHAKLKRGSEIRLNQPDPRLPCCNCIASSGLQATKLPLCRLGNVKTIQTKSHPNDATVPRVLTSKRQ